MEAYSEADQLFSEDKLKLLYNRLPYDCQKTWLKLKGDKVVRNEKVSFKDMRIIIDKYVLSRDNPFFLELNNNNSGNDRSSVKKKGPSVYAQQHNAGQDKGKQIKCLLCKEGDHYLNRCTVFLAKTIPQRKEYVSSQKLCFNCFSVKHLSKDCQRNGLCRKCTGKHNETLHIDYNKGGTRPVDSTEVKDMDKLAATTMATAGAEVNRSAAAGLSCVEVVLRGQDSLVKTLAVVDKKSTANLMSKELAQRLNLPM